MIAPSRTRSRRIERALVRLPLWATASPAAGEFRKQRLHIAQDCPRRWSSSARGRWRRGPSTGRWSRRPRRNRPRGRGAARSGTPSRRRRRCGRLLAPVLQGVQARAPRWRRPPGARRCRRRRIPRGACRRRDRNRRWDWWRVTCGGRSLTSPGGDGPARRLSRMQSVHVRTRYLGVPRDRTYGEYRRSASRRGRRGLGTALGRRIGLGGGVGRLVGRRGGLRLLELLQEAFRVLGSCATRASPDFSSIGRERACAAQSGTLPWTSQDRNTSRSRRSGSRGPPRTGSRASGRPRRCANRARRPRSSP